MTGEPQTVQLSVGEGIATITLDRPDRMNALDPTTANAWRAAVHRALDNDSVRAIVLQAEGPSFCAGGDVLSMAEGGHDISALARTLNDGIGALIGSVVPVIAAAQGTTVGGGLGLLLASDYAIVSDDARIGSLYSEMALTPDLSVTAQLGRAVGQRRALQLALTPRLLTASEALEWGLVAEAVPRGRVRERALELAATIAAGPSAAYGQAKRLIRAEPSNTLSEQLSDEALTIGRAAATPEARRRIAAFAARSGRATS